MRVADGARPTHSRSAASPADPQIVPELQGSDSILQHHSVRSTADTKADTIQTLESLVFGGERGASPIEGGTGVSNCAQIFVLTWTACCQLHERWPFGLPTVWVILTLRLPM